MLSKFVKGSSLNRFLFFKVLISARSSHRILMCVCVCHSEYHLRPRSILCLFFLAFSMFLFVFHQLNVFRSWVLTTCMQGSEAEFSIALRPQPGFRVTQKVQQSYIMLWACPSCLARGSALMRWPVRSPVFYNHLFFSCGCSSRHKNNFP